MCDGDRMRVPWKLFSALLIGLAGAAGILVQLCRSAFGTSKVELTQDDLTRIAKGHTPLDQWPAVDETIFAPGTFAPDPPERVPQRRDD